MSDPEPIRPGFESEYFSDLLDLKPSERAGMVALVNAGFTGAQAREIIKDPNIGGHRVDDFIGLLKLGLTPAEIRNDFDNFRMALSFATPVRGFPNQRLITRAWEARRFVAMLRKGLTPSQAMGKVMGGSGCLLVVLATGFIASASFTLLVILIG